MYMSFDKLVFILIIIHASLGGIALLAGLVALIVKKGNSNHKKFGKLFMYAMLFSAIIALIISVLPQHESPFLFAVAVFSTYFIITGYSAIRFKNDTIHLNLDKIISWTMIITGVVMIFYHIIVHHSIHIVMTVFGAIGLIFAIRDIILFQKPESLKSGWLKLHLGKMIGGYISATTAFVVVNEFFSSIYGWFIPGIIGGIYIRYWMRKLNKTS